VTSKPTPSTRPTSTSSWIFHGSGGHGGGGDRGRRLQRFQEKVETVIRATLGSPNQSRKRRVPGRLFDKESKIKRLNRMKPREGA